MKNLLCLLLVTSSLTLWAQEDAIPETLVPDTEEVLNTPPSEVSTLEAAPVEETSVTSEEDTLPEIATPAPTATLNETSLPSPEELREERSAEPAKQPDNKIVTNKFDDDAPFNHRKSHWVTNFGFEGTQYKVPFSYVGTKKSYDEESLELQGGRVGVGYEAYMGWGFLLGGRIDGYYMGTTFNRERFAKNVGNTQVRGEENRAQMYGGDLVGHAGWMFDYKTKNPFLDEMTYMAMELFAEAGVGAGQTYFTKEYFNRDSVDELYRGRITESYRSTTVSAGINFLSRTTGFFLNLKVSQMFLDVDETKIKAVRGDSTATTTTNEDINNPDKDPVTIISVGGGYKF